MKKMSLQWRLTCIITLYIAVICGCLTMLVYKNGVYYIDSLKETVDARGDEKADDTDEIYISIPEDNWDEFANDFSVQVYNNKTDYRKNSLIISAVLALLGGVATYFISGHALRPIREFSDKIEEVQAQNLADSRLEENKVKELNQLSVSYNKMLGRLSDAFEVQRQFTANAAHELRTPLALMQVQLDSYNSGQHPGSDAETVQTIRMVTEQNDRLSKMVKTLLDMSELQTVSRDETIMVDSLVDEVLADLEPLAREKDVELTGNCEAITIVGSDILIYRLVYNLVENAIKYNHSGGQVSVEAYQREKQVYLSVKDTGNGIPEELKERVFEPFFRVDKSRSREPWCGSMDRCTKGVDLIFLADLSEPDAAAGRTDYDTDMGIWNERLLRLPEFLHERQGWGTDGICKFRMGTDGYKEGDSGQSDKRNLGCIRIGPTASHAVQRAENYAAGKI